MGYRKVQIDCQLRTYSAREVNVVVGVFQGQVI